jgi:hypothetical protein
MAVTLPRLSVRRYYERAALTRMQLAHERALEAHLATALIGIGREAAKSYRQDGDVTNSGAIAHNLVRVLRPSLVNTARAFASHVTNNPKHSHAFEHKAFEDIDAAIAEFMAEHAAEAIVGISETTRTAILNAIQNGQDDDLSVEEIAQKIVEVTSGEIGIARARRIARTETHGAAMYGQQAAAEASPLEFQKTWLATEDSRTRPDHAEANGQTVGLYDHFTVGGHHLFYPGDQSAPPEQIINCRCVCTFDPVGFGDD